MVKHTHKLSKNNFELDGISSKELKAIIDDISTSLHIHVYYFEFPSELNNLNPKGSWQLFLNEKQTNKKLWNDFLILIRKLHEYSPIGLLNDNLYIK